MYNSVWRESGCAREVLSGSASVRTPILSICPSTSSLLHLHLRSLVSLTLNATVQRPVFALLEHFQIASSDHKVSVCVIHSLPACRLHAAGHLACRDGFVPSTQSLQKIRSGLLSKTAVCQADTYDTSWAILE